jgi:nitrile hydratase subunit alpha
LSGDHGELPVAARVRRLEERLIAAGLATDAELDEVLIDANLSPRLASSGP